jgi:hypothetical protein
MTQPPSDPWAGIAVMPPWWHQNHRLAVVTAKGAWVCSCGAKGRNRASEAVQVLYNKHIDRVKQRGKEENRVYHIPNRKLPRYPYAKIAKRDHSALGSLFVQTNGPLSAQPLV